MELFLLSLFTNFVEAAHKMGFTDTKDKFQHHQFIVKFIITLTLIPVQFKFQVTFNKHTKHVVLESYLIIASLGERITQPW